MLFRSKGKVRYSFTRKLKGAPVDELPEGYEIHEAPDCAQVHLRKAIQTEILPLEKELLATLIRKAGVKHFIIDLEESAMVVYVAESDDNLFKSSCSKNELLGGLLRMLHASRSESDFLRQAKFTAMMRFVLRMDKGERHFSCQRWCFRGGIERWIHLMGASGPLMDVAGRYVVHLGKESFYDLM